MSSELVVTPRVEGVAARDGKVDANEVEVLVAAINIRQGIIITFSKKKTSNPPQKKKNKE